MGRMGHILVGVFLFAAAAGVFGYRLMNEPAGLERSSWLAGEENATSPQQAPAPEGARPQGGDGDALQPQTAPEGHSFSAARRSEDAQSPRKQLNNMKLLELGLDVANVLVGLIGIYLTVSGMRMRRQVRS